MRDLFFYLKSFNGKGWFIPIYDLMKKTEFKDQAIQLVDLNIYTLSDILRLIKSNQLSETLKRLNIENREIYQLEGLLRYKVFKLETFDKKQKWFLPGLIIYVFLIFLFLNIYIEKYNIGLFGSANNSFLTKSLSIRSNSDSRASLNINKTYKVVSKSYGFATSKLELDQLLEASRSDDTQKISQMMMVGTVKTFPPGKEVYLVDQGLSTIIIKDPESGRNYYGVTESIH
jgi:hypothetical protein